MARAKLKIIKKVFLLGSVLIHGGFFGSKSKFTKKQENAKIKYMEGGKYSLEKAEEEANALRKKVDLGVAENYDEAEKQFEAERHSQYSEEELKKNQIRSLEEILPGIKLDGLPTLQQARENLDQQHRLGKKFYGSLSTDYASLPYTTLLSERDAHRHAEELSRLRNQVIVDLGAGDFAYGLGIAEMVGARAYIGVEKFNFQGLEHAIGNRFLRSGDKLPSDLKRIPVAIVPEDALGFLKRLPDKSVSVMSFGGSGIGLEFGNKRHDYQENEIGKEIVRVLHPEGAFITGATDDDSLSVSGILFKNEKLLRGTVKQFLPETEMGRIGKLLERAIFLISNNFDTGIAQLERAGYFESDEAKREFIEKYKEVWKKYMNMDPKAKEVIDEMKLGIRKKIAELTAKNSESKSE
ncbi:hypothetical protein A3I40_01800 [Candidatus Uhrbacteria bacterium RIFCSPLOWO2_02_FULL_48_12]|uniref:Uncharacterized protein n=1 Tax=Candidatus Uhrbacteria bacterium RIFCSPLOWO2_02_FULL_48_12 TaxID=1802407 RepID=A0A1F7V6H1_9BACT|nr:MAG: hypothetical protein A3I40_01800 [Candidatus Uhrbacteria bacterium RIFCSPLOWO2_02_FULL_48_12]